MVMIAMLAVLVTLVMSGRFLPPSMQPYMTRRPVTAAKVHREVADVGPHTYWGCLRRCSKRVDERCWPEFKAQAWRRAPSGGLWGWLWQQPREALAWTLPFFPSPPASLLSPPPLSMIATKESRVLTDGLHLLRLRLVSVVVGALRRRRRSTFAPAV